uniref:RING-type E3 ubiquitin transferase n=1 Tax=Hyaloperonospora arabidopsidis (strain Emoy2) TaxID=559515 RepID=M4BAQ4_HYAAE
MTPCSFFAAGKCRSGRSCKFFHASREDLAVSPLPCKFFLQNACKAGRECKFSHSAKAQVAATVVSASTGYKAIAAGSYGVPCKFFKHGDCSNGNRCPYLHVQKKKTKEKQLEEKAEVQVKESIISDKFIEEEKEEAGVVAETLCEQEQEAETMEDMKDFISKEEGAAELYYYGAPGEFMDATVESVPPMLKESYVDVIKKNVEDRPLSFDEEMSAPPKICTFFLQGSCRYGNACFYAHSLSECAQSEEEMLARDEEICFSQDLECGICYECVVDKDERFGLLSGCNHVFCLTCLRNWRGNADQPKQTVRQCPVCRVETSFIIPSSRMVTKPERKKVLIDEYRKNLSAIPCRHFNEGRGTCPFGTSCFYAHRFPDGTLDTRQVRTAVDADGQYDVLRQVRLEQYFQRNGSIE